MYLPGGPMRKLIVFSMVTALLLFVGTFPSFAQDTKNDQTPIFYHPTPGTYVNGWPRFTIHYPKEWVERRPMANENYRASVPGPVPFPSLGVMVSYPVPLDKVADAVVTAVKSYATNVTLVSDKPSRLRDGTSARELEVRMVVNGVPWSFFDVVIRKGEVLIHAVVRSTTGTIGEDLKAIPYSIEFKPEKDNPVKVPPDVEAFFEAAMGNRISHDLVKIMADYSDRYLNSGVKKGEMERFHRDTIDRVTSCKITVTDFVPAGDRAYYTGFVVCNFGTFQAVETSIIKENGEWKWYGNQRDFAP
jgi:hypothetical protein